jgi:hypothetical protein
VFQWKQTMLNQEKCVQRHFSVNGEKRKKNKTKDPKIATAKGQYLENSKKGGVK